MSILLGNNSYKENDGCGGKLLQKTESLMKKIPHKSSSYSSSAMSNYIVQNDRSLSIMPQKTYIFWLLILIIFFMAAVNFTILLIMMSVLHIGEGMEGIEMLSNEEIIKFHGNSDLDYVIYENGVFKGFRNIPLEIIGNEGPIIMALEKYGDVLPTNKLKIAYNEIAFLDVEKFDVVDPDSGIDVFSTDYRDFKIPKGLSHLDMQKLRVNRLISTQNSNLTIKSDTITRLRGNEGIKIQGKDITFVADGDIYLNSVNGSIHLLADSIKIDVKRVPIAIIKTNIGRLPTSQYKLCVCMPQGVLFKVPVPKDIKSHLACSFVDLSLHNNPCVKW